MRETAVAAVLPDVPPTLGTPSVISVFDPDFDSPGHDDLKGECKEREVLLEVVFVPKVGCKWLRT